MNYLNLCCIKQTHEKDFNFFMGFTPLVINDQKRCNQTIIKANHHNKINNELYIGRN